MQGEPKKEMYDLLPPELYPTTLYFSPEDDFAVIKEKIKSQGIDYPFVVKPQVGEQGILFRKIDNERELAHYHKHVKVEYLVQRLVEHSMEVSVFYVRYPNEEKGTVTGFLHKIPLQVIGNGKDTLEQLVLLHPKGKKRIGELHSKHKDQWNTIIPEGEKYMLSYAANHNRGAHFIDLKEHIDDKLSSIFDQISHRIDDFFYGRYDIMCNSVEELKSGKSFMILEYNGCGAEPNHFYDTGYTLIGAYKEILKHWKALYKISKYNSNKGIKPWPYKKGRAFLKNAKRYIDFIRETDKNI